jgi:hypothetical protein
MAKSLIIKNRSKQYGIYTLKYIIMIRSSQAHYDNGKNYDVIDVINDFNLNFSRGNILKYICRAGKKKDELQDLLKAKDYLEREIEIIREAS